MNRLHWMQVVAPVTAAAAILAVAAPAAAAPCPTTATNGGTPVIVMRGSSASKPLIAAVGQTLANSSTATIIYTSDGSSCSGGVASLVADPAGGGVPAIATWTKAATGNYWTSATTPSTPIACDPDAGGATTIDVGISDVFPTTCPDFSSTTIPASIGDFHGPIQAMNFVVPSGAAPTFITYEAAHFLFSATLNALSTVGTWTQPTEILVRGTGSGTQGMLGTAIGVPSAKWINNSTSQSSTQVLIAALQQMTGDAPIGIVASTDYDTSQKVVLTDGGAATTESPRSVLKILAYSHIGQSCAYYPDSSNTTFDKQNVRDGHYAVWGPLHFLTAVDGNGVPTNATVKTVLAAIQGTTQDIVSDSVLTASINAHTIPQCAMSVARSAEMGPIASYAPTNACNCYFMATATGTAPSSCKACASDTDCAGNAGATHCSVYQHASGADAGADAGTNQGYCEAQ